MKKLYRSRTHQMLGGVCMGIAKHLNIDVSLVRLIWVLLGLSWVGVPAYIIAWIIIPEEPESDEMIVVSDADSRGADTRTIGLIIVAVGLYLFIRQIIPFALWGRFFWPVLIVAVGLLIMFGGFRRGQK